MTNSSIHHDASRAARALTRAVLCLALASLATPSAFAQEREDRISRTFDVGGSGELSLSNVSGDIRVEGASGDEIRVEAVKRLHGRAGRDLLDAVTIDFSHTGDRVRIDTRYPRDGGSRGHDHDHGGVSVDYTITVPTGTEVEIGSVSGNVDVSGVDGETSVSSVSGTVRVRDTDNLVQAKSVSGEVEVHRAGSDGYLEIASVSGDVQITEVTADELDVSSVSGDVRMDALMCQQGEFDSVSGDILYSGRIAEGGRYEFKSHSGDVIITIGDEIGFELEANTFSGDIESDFEMRLGGGDRRRRDVSAVIGDGSAFIDATTFSGDIELRTR